MTVGEFRDWLLDEAADAATLARIAPGLTPEMAAAVSQTHAQPRSDRRRRAMPGRHRLSHHASACRAGWPRACSPTIRPTTRRHRRLDRRRPAFGCGDAVIGINPATDNVDDDHPHLLAMLDELRQKLDIPTQSCVLAHVTTTIAAIEQGAPVDLVFQSIAGTEAANAGFGVDSRSAARGAARRRWR